MRRFRVLTVPIMVLVLAIGSSSAVASESSPPDDYVPSNVAPCASQFWERDIAAFDTAVANEVEERSWFFGPPISDLMAESYSASDYTERQVQYWEKGRKECTPVAPDIGLESTFTLGLLAYELVTGQIQVSHDRFVDHAPADIHVAGDPGIADAVTYESFNRVVDNEARAVGEVEMGNIGMHYYDWRYPEGHE